MLQDICGQIISSVWKMTCFCKDRLVTSTLIWPYDWASVSCDELETEVNMHFKMEPVIIGSNIHSCVLSEQPGTRKKP